MRAITLFALFSVLASVTSEHTLKNDTRDNIIGNGHLPKSITDIQGNIHLTYGSGDSIMYVSSSNKGTSFSKPQLVAVLPNLFANAMRGPQIAVASSGILITANNQYGNIYSYHRDLSGRWSKAVKVNDMDSVSKEALTALSADGNNAFAAWLDVRSNGGKGQRLFGARSTDGGLTWSKNMMIYASPDKTICECCKPSVLVKGNTVYAMFRNWLDGNRDLYLIKSPNLGQSFGEANKLGKGSWKLNGCPMDGGGLTLSPQYVVETVWRREGNIYTSSEGKPEVLLGEGRSCTMASLNGKNAYSWTKNGEVLLLIPGQALMVLGKGSVPVVNWVSKDSLLCVWENDAQIHAGVVKLQYAK